MGLIKKGFSMKNSLKKVLILLLILISSTIITSAKDSAIIIFDASGSMWGQIEGKNKITIAREVMGTLVTDWNKEIELGLMAYGHRKKGDCNDIEMLQEISPVDSKKILNFIKKINPKGKTPISQSLKEAYKKLKKIEEWI